jgi:AcrR family transcriptional regulator
LDVDNATALQNPRVERSREAILDATRELLAADGGVRALTVEAVAARSGVAKTTIYRQWRDKWELALDAVMIDMVPRLAGGDDVGDTRAELMTFIDSVVQLLCTRPFGPAMQALVSVIATEPELAEAYRTRAIQPRRERLAQLIERGIARGDLRPDTSTEVLHEFLLGPVFYRLLLSGGALDDRLAGRLVDELLAGFAPRPPAEREGGQSD